MIKENELAEGISAVIDVGKHSLALMHRLKESIGGERECFAYSRP
jgi:hypothetical protein